MLVLPLAVVLVFSFGERGQAGGYVPAFTLDPDPQLCLDFHSGWPGNSGAVGHGGPDRHKADQHAVLVGIVYGYLPLMVFPIFVSLERLDKRLLEASADLGSPPWRSFLQITLPLIMPGILAGFLLSFTFSFDDFIIAFFVAGANTTLPIMSFRRSAGV